MKMAHYRRFFFCGRHNGPKELSFGVFGKQNKNLATGAMKKERKSCRSNMDNREKESKNNLVEPIVLKHNR
jgi:hypothetical protein